MRFFIFGKQFKIEILDILIKFIPFKDLLSNLIITPEVFSEKYTIETKLPIFFNPMACNMTCSSAPPSPRSKIKNIQFGD